MSGSVGENRVSLHGETGSYKEIFVLESFISDFDAGNLETRH